MAVPAPYVLYVGDEEAGKGRSQPSKRRLVVAASFLAVACVAVLALSTVSSGDGVSRSALGARTEDLWSFSTAADDGRGVNGGQQHGVTRTVSACDGDDPECVFEVSADGYSEGRWVRLKDGKPVEQTPGTIRVQADHAKPSSWEDDVGDRRSRLSRSGADGVFRAPVRPPRPAFVEQTVHFPPAQHSRASVAEFDADVRGGSRAPQDAREYVIERTPGGQEVVVEPGAEDAEKGGEEGSVPQGQGVAVAPRSEGEDQVAGDEGEEASENFSEMGAQEEEPGPLQSVATEIAIESRQYEKLLKAVKAEDAQRAALQDELRASRSRLGELMEKQLSLVKMLGGAAVGEQAAGEDADDAEAKEEPAGEEAAGEDADDAEAKEDEGDAEAKEEQAGEQAAGEDADDAEAKEDEDDAEAKEEHAGEEAAGEDADDAEAKEDEGDAEAKEEHAGEQAPAATEEDRGEEPNHGEESPESQEESGPAEGQEESGPAATEEGGKGEPAADAA
jgi:hypothetical protein